MTKRELEPEYVALMEKVYERVGVPVGTVKIQHHVYDWKDDENDETVRSRINVQVDDKLSTSVFVIKRNDHIKAYFGNPEQKIVLELAPKENVPVELSTEYTVSEAG